MSGRSNGQACPAAMPTDPAAAPGEWPWALVDSKLSWGQSALKQERCRVVAPSLDERSQVAEQTVCAVSILGGFSRPTSIKPSSSWSELAMDHFKQEVDRETF